MSRFYAAGAACLALTFMSGCATILNDDTQKINVVSSNGQPISGTIDGRPFKGPGIVEVQRANKDKILVTETDGCVKQTILNKSVDTKFFINVLSGGVFGSSTDYSSEEMWQYDESVTIQCNS